MIRCPWCGAKNYAIDSWCTSCSRHLDWAPPPPTAVIPPPPPPAVIAPPPPPAATALPPQPAVAMAPVEPPSPRRRRRLIVLAPAAAAVGVAIVLALPVASWFNAAGRTPTLPNTALRPAAPSTSAPSMPAVQPTPTAEATATPDATPTPDENSAGAPLPAVVPAPTAEPAPETQPNQANVVTGGDPAAAVARFYQDVSGHDFAAAAALWTSRMQARYPPAQYIDHRFAATQQINLQAARILGNSGGLATIYVRVVEVMDGQTRHWVGTWQVVNTSSGWLLNQPNLRAA
jgi:hypothetical protein